LWGAKAHLDSQAALDTVGRVRDAIHQVNGAEAIAGGDSATRGDTLNASSHDNKVIIPLILLVVVVILMALLRAVVAPLILIATVVLSFGGGPGAQRTDLPPRARLRRRRLGRCRYSCSCSSRRSGSTTTSF